MDIIIKIIEAVSTILCLVGCIYGTIPRRIGLWFLIAGTITWLIFALYNQHWFFLSQEVFLLGLNIISLKTWKEQGIPF